MGVCESGERERETDRSRETQAERETERNHLETERNHLEDWDQDKVWDLREKEETKKNKEKGVILERVTKTEWQVWQINEI